MTIKNYILSILLIFITISRIYSGGNSKENSCCEFVPCSNERIAAMKNSEFKTLLAQFAMHCDHQLKDVKNKKLIKINISFGDEEASASSSLINTSHGTLKNNKLTKNKISKKKKNKKKQAQKRSNYQDEFEDPEVKEIIAQIEKDRVLFASGRSLGQGARKNNRNDDDQKTLLEKLRDKIFFKQYSRFSDESRERIREDVGCDSDSDHDRDSNYDRNSNCNCDCDNCRKSSDQKLLSKEDLSKISVTQIYANETAPNPDNIAYLSIAFQHVEKKPVGLFEKKNSGIIPYTYYDKDIKFFYGKEIFEDISGNMYLIKRDISSKEIKDEEELVKILNIIPHFYDE